MASYKEHVGYIARYGVATPNRFKALIPIPSIMQTGGSTQRQLAPGQQGESIFAGGGGLIDTGDPIQRALNSLGTVRGPSGSSQQTAARGLDVMCEKAPIPGKSIMTADHRYNADYLKKPYGVAYDDQQMVFHASGDMYEKVILDTWMNLIIDHRQHQVAYLDDIVSNITISQLDRQDNPVYTVELLNAYPIMVNAVNLDNQALNSVQRVTVTFAFSHWHPVQANGDDGGNSNSGPASSLAETPMGSMLSPVLDNPGVQRGLDFIEQTTGQDLEGEALNMYNRVDDIVRNTTGQDIDQSIAMVEGIKNDAENNGYISEEQRTKLRDMITETTRRMRG